MTDADADQMVMSEQDRFRGALLDLTCQAANLIKNNGISMRAISMEHKLK